MWKRPYYFLVFIISCHQAPIAVIKPGKTVDSLEIPFHPLRNESDLDVLLADIGDARIVLLGESTHGTHEFYEWRTAITKRLIKEKGFDFIAIEGDWVDTYRVN